MAVEREAVVSGTSEWIQWWVEQRKMKLREQVDSTMSINPLMLPVVFKLHSLSGFDELSDLFIGSHLMTGHSTGFGKLVDEKILPNVFGTKKFDAAFRKANHPLLESCFDEIDHVIPRGSNKSDLLSLKASKWTIQLTMAVQLNNAFNEIIERFGSKYGKIVVGVYYGKAENLTDKYDILRGINRGKRHDVVDITERVDVCAGRDFWSWINGGETKTQDWVLEGILEGLEKDATIHECEGLLKDFKAKVRGSLSHHKRPDGSIDWSSLLTEING